MVKEKNADELFQSFVWHTQAVDINRAKRDPQSVSKLSPEKAKADGQQGTFSVHRTPPFLLFLMYHPLIFSSPSPPNAHHPPAYQRRSPKAPLRLLSRWP